MYICCIRIPPHKPSLYMLSANRIGQYTTGCKYKDNLVPHYLFQSRCYYVHYECRCRISLMIKKLLHEYMADISAVRNLCLVSYRMICCISNSYLRACFERHDFTTSLLLRVMASCNNRILLKLVTVIENDYLPPSCNIVYSLTLNT